LLEWEVAGPIQFSKGTGRGRGRRVTKSGETGILTHGRVIRKRRRKRRAKTYRGKARINVFSPNLGLRDREIYLKYEEEKKRFKKKKKRGAKP